MAYRTRFMGTSDPADQPATLTGKPANGMAGVIDARPTFGSSNPRRFQFSLGTLCLVLLCFAGLFAIAAQSAIGAAMVAPAVVGYGLSRSPDAGTATVFCWSILIPICLLAMFLLFGE